MTISNSYPLFFFDGFFEFFLGEVLTAFGDFGDAFAAFVAAIEGAHAMFGDGFAVLPGEDAEEVLEECGTGFWGGGKCEGAHGHSRAMGQQRQGRSSKTANVTSSIRPEGALSL